MYEEHGNQIGVKIGGRAGENEKTRYCYSDIGTFLSGSKQRGSMMAFWSGENNPEHTVESSERESIRVRRRGAIMLRRVGTERKGGAVSLHTYLVPKLIFKILFPSILGFAQRPFRTTTRRAGLSRPRRL